MDANALVIIALCFNVLVLAVGAMSGKKDKLELHLRAVKAEIKAELLENMLGLMLEKKSKCSCKEPNNIED